MEADESSHISSRRGTQAHVRTALLVLCTIGILAVVAGMEVYKVSATTLAYQATLERSTKAQARVRQVLSMLQEAETSQRGFLVTRGDDYLRRFKAIERQIREPLARLADVPSDHVMQASRAGRLRELAFVRLGQLLDALAADSLAGQTAFRRLGPVMEPVMEQDHAAAVFRTKMEMHALANDMIAFQDRTIRTASRGLRERTRSARSLLIPLLASIVALVSVVVMLGLAYLTQRGRVEMELREATRLASEASEAKTVFLAAMSHEVRTPLTGILGYTELLMDEPLTSTQRDYARRLQIAGVGLSTLVDDILDFSKIEAGEIDIVEAPFSLAGLIANCLSISSMTARKKELRLRSEIDPALPEAVLGDEPRLRQVLLNLLNNAVKFTDDGSVTLRAARRSDPGVGECIRFEVADTGIGIEPSRQHRLFQDFSQASASIQHEYGGTGLGLAISRRLVELMGGEIGLESGGGRGSTFWFTVPLAKAETVDPERLDEVDAAGVASGRILLAEDAPQNRDLVRTILERQGYRVDVACDGEEAVAAVRSTAYDLVLMDIQMPRMDGATATRQIRQMPGRAGKVPIIAMTANVLPEQLRCFRKAGLSDQIAKPFRKHQLIEKVRKGLSAETSPPAATRPDAIMGRAPDRATFEELRDLMGEAWVRASLRRLNRRIDEAFGDPADRAPAPEQLERRAHQIVSDAGQLGFSELSESCGVLEEACSGKGDIAPALTRARHAAERVRTMTERLLSRT